MTNFQLQTSLTTQIMEFTNETRTAVVVAAYRAARAPGVDTEYTSITPHLQKMLQDEIDLFVEENPELFPVDESTEDDGDDERREQLSDFYRDCGSVFSK